MSHTTTIKGVQIKDRRAIEQAVADLVARGVRVELRTNTTPRMFYDHQAAEVGICDYVLYLPTASYDVGLKWDAKAEEFNVILDTWAGEIERVLGAKNPTAEDGALSEGERAIGAFMNRYAINVAKNTHSALYPMETLSETTDAHGNTHLFVAFS